MGSGETGYQTAMGIVVVWTYAYDYVYNPYCYKVIGFVSSLAFSFSFHYFLYGVYQVLRVL